MLQTSQRDLVSMSDAADSTVSLRDTKLDQEIDVG